jgi:hypothetical protein
MTGNIWIDLELSLADVEAELPDMSGELPAYRMGNVDIRERSTMHSTSTSCLAVRALSRPWPRGRSPMQVLISPDDDAPRRCMCVLHAGGEEAGSRGNGFR